MKELLDGVEVQWKTLGEIVTGKFWIMPATPNFDENGKIPYITSKNIKNGQINFEKVKMISNENYIQLSKNRPIITGDILISMIGTIGEVARVKNTDLDFYGQNMYLIRLNENLIKSDFFLHFFDSPNIKKYFNSVKNKSSQGYLKAKDIEGIEIPIPPLDIQEKIVEILDNFTELTAELTARKKQYEYYRDELLTFDDNEVEWKKLGDVFDFRNGINKGKEYFGSGESIINYMDVYKNSKIFENSIVGKVETTEIDRERFGCYKGDVFFTRTSETKDEIGYASVLLSEISTCVFSGFLIRARPKTKLLLPEYCSYCFKSSQIRKEIIKSSNMTTRVTITGRILSKIKIPIPSLEEQERIVSILDKFDTLTSSITEGLPREIELRQKQYEYYRDMLLNFPKEKEDK